MRTLHRTASVAALVVAALIIGNLIRVVANGSSIRIGYFVLFAAAAVLAISLAAFLWREPPQ